MEINPATYSGPRFFGAPVGEFSVAQTLLFIFASTVATFLAGTFLGIVGVGIYSASVHHMADFAISYTYIGLPCGVLMLLASTLYLGSLLLRRLFRKA